MKILEKPRKSPASALLLSFLLTVIPATASTPPSVNVIHPNDAMAQTGKTYEEWSEAWWKYVLEIPFENNPLFDETGANCNFAQSGDVFFLVSTAGGTATRNECIVPAGKVIYFSLLGAVRLKEVDGPEPEIAARSSIQGVSKSTRELRVFVDGQDVGISLFPRATPLRTLSTPGFFTIDAPENNVFGLAPNQYHGVADGFYLMLAPLSPGPHEITFGGTTAGFSSYVTYNLVVDEP
ncbi:MAG TPA: hypothetical protein VJU86_23390 [Pyrinomonadaceae bacterium]|nr:hypothetical protein [Pyrinomonadaceae bacterium]